MIKQTEQERKEAKRKGDFLYRQRNLEKIKAQQADYRNANREKLRAYFRAIRVARPEKFRTQEFLERSRKHCHRYYQSNQEMLKYKARARRAANPEKYRQLDKISRTLHRETRLKYGREHNSKTWPKRAEQRRHKLLNDPVYREKQKLYRLANKARFAANAKRWQRANKERIALRNKKWAAANRDKLAAKDHQRRALKKAASINLAGIAVFYRQVKSKKTVICYYCEQPTASKGCHFDHIVPLSRGGIHAVENLCVSCPSCNLSKSAKTPTEWVRVGQQVLNL